MGPHASPQQGGNDPTKGRGLSVSHVANSSRTCKAVMDFWRTRQHVRDRMSFSLRIKHFTT
eukprot:4545241-Pyramimonas_sp.AAC.2